jgi:hypothetical protein
VLLGNGRTGRGNARELSRLAAQSASTPMDGQSRPAMNNLEEIFLALT